MFVVLSSRYWYDSVIIVESENRNFRVGEVFFNDNFVVGIFKFFVDYDVF